MGCHSVMPEERMRLNKDPAACIDWTSGGAQAGRGTARGGAFKSPPWEPSDSIPADPDTVRPVLLQLLISVDTYSKIRPCWRAIAWKTAHTVLKWWWWWWWWQCWFCNQQRTLPVDVIVTPFVHLSRSHFLPSTSFPSSSFPCVIPSSVVFMQSTCFDIIVIVLIFFS